MRITKDGAKVVTMVKMGLEKDGVYGYYPDVVEVAPDVLVVTDGLGGLSIVHGVTVNQVLDEVVPFVLFDAKLREDGVDVLICQAVHEASDASTRQPARGEYLLRDLRIPLPPSPDSQYSVNATLIGSEIPKYAILTPDILVVSQSPFRLQTSTSDIETMDLDDQESPPPPLYTYFQTLTDLDISIPLPLDTPKSAIQIQFSTATLQLSFHPPTSPNDPDLSETFPFQTSDEKPLWGAIDPQSSTWTLSSTTTSKVLDIHLEKVPELASHWPQVFAEPDGAEEYTDPSDRRSILERLEKYTSSTSTTDTSDPIRRRFLLEEDEDIDSISQGDGIQFFQLSGKLRETHNQDVLAIPFEGSTLGLKHSIDMCCFDMLSGVHEISVPAFAFVASSKRLRKFVRYTDRFACIVESGKGGNMYVYYVPDEERGETARQVVVRLGVDSLGIGLIRDVGIVVIGEGKDGYEAVIVGGL